MTRLSRRRTGALIATAAVVGLAVSSSQWSGSPEHSPATASSPASGSSRSGPTGSARVGLAAAASGSTSATTPTDHRASTVAARGPVGNAASAAATPAADSPAVRALQSASGGTAWLVRDSSGQSRALRTVAAHPVALPAGLAPPTTPRTDADAYLRRYGSLLGITDLAAQLRSTGSRSLGGGASTVHYELRSAGLPVFAGGVVVALDGAGRLTAITGHGVLGPVRDGRVAAATAATTARDAVARGARLSAAGLHVTAPERVVYDPAMVGDLRGGAPGTVWQVHVSGGSLVRRLVLVDTTTGAVRVSADELERDAPNPTRTVCDVANRRVTGQTGTGAAPTIAQGGYGCTYSAAVRREGSTASSGIADADSAYTYAGDTANFYQQALGVNLTQLIGTSDGMNAKALRSTTRVCTNANDGTYYYDPCPYPNAFWDGSQMVYGAGYAGALDVVGHEMTHGVTQQTSHLAYVFQPGAINESMSDVMGELVQQWTAQPRAVRPFSPPADPSWLLGENLPGGAIRSMSAPGAYDQPDAMTSPQFVALTDPLDWAWDNGGVHTNSGVGNQAAYLMARGGTLNGVTVPALAKTAAGLAKVAEIYYQTEQLMTPGTNYLDLAADLQQACTDLTTRSGLVTPVSSADCGSVTAAVAATRMTSQPAAASAQLTQASYCTGSDVQAPDVFGDDFGTGGSDPKWTFTNPAPYATASSVGPGTAPAGPGTVTVGTPGPYSTSGTGSMYGQTSYNTGAGSYPAISATISVPSVSGRHPYLRFAHADELEWYPVDNESGNLVKPRGYYDGGRVQISVLTGATWSAYADLGSRFVKNDGTLVSSTGLGVGGYDHTIYDGKAAFGGYSGGWETNRVDLAPYAGQSVRLQFVTVGDATVASDWFVDDVEVYTCGPATTPGPATGLAAATSSAGSATLSWAPPTLPSGASISGYTVSATQVSTTTILTPARSPATFAGLDPTQDTTLTVVAHTSAGDSPPATLTVRGSLLVAVTAGRPVVAPGGSLPLTGQLTQPTNGAGLIGVPLSVWFCPSTDPAGCVPTSTGWAQQPTAAVSQTDGRVATTLRPTQTGYWQLRYGGAADRFPARSAPRLVTVTAPG